MSEQNDINVYLGPYQISYHVQINSSKLLTVNSFQFSVAFHIETKHFFKPAK